MNFAILVLSRGVDSETNNWLRCAGSSINHGDESMSDSTSGSSRGKNMHSSLNLILDKRSLVR